MVKTIFQWLNIGITICILLLLWLNLPLHAQILGTMEVTPVPVQDRGAWINTDPDRAILVVYSEIGKVSFATNHRGVIKVETPDPGVFLVHLFPGTHIITFTAGGFKSVDYRIHIPAKEIAEVNLRVIRAGQQEGLGNIRIETDPPSCYVVFNGIRLPEKTPLTITGQHVGEHKIQIDGGFEWQAIDSTITVIPDSTVTYRFKLAPGKSTRLTIISEPVGADVYIDDKPYGQTPLTRNDLTSGRHSLKLIYNKYEDYSDEINISTNQDNRFVLNMVPKTGSIELTVKPPGSEIFLDEKSAGLSEKQPYKSDYILTGEHKISAVKNGYESEERVCRVEKGKTNQIEITLTPLPASLSISSSPIGAKIFLNGEELDKLTPLELAKTPSGKIKLRARLAGYHSSKNSSVLKPGEKREINFLLHPKKRTSAVWRSMIFPGSGQRFAGHETRGWLMTGLQIATLAYAVYGQINYMDADQTYKDAEEQYRTAFSAVEIQAARANLSSAFDDLDKAKKSSDLAFGIAGGMYMINLLDVSFLGGGKINFHSRPILNQSGGRTK